MAYQTRDRAPLLDSRTQAAVERRGKELLGLALIAGAALFAVMLATYSPDDPNWMLASEEPARNGLGRFGASVAHPLVMILGRAAWGVPLALGAWGLRLATHRGEARARAVLAPLFVALLAVAWAALTPDGGRAAGYGWGGLFGDTVLGLLLTVVPVGSAALPLALWAGALALGLYVLGFTRAELAAIRRRAALALVLGYDMMLRGAGQGARGLGHAVREGRGRVSAALERRAARRAEDRALLEAEDRALRAWDAEPFEPADVPAEARGGAPRPSARGAARVPVLRASAAEGPAAPKAHLMPPPLRPQPAPGAASEADDGAPDWDDLTGLDHAPAAPTRAGPGPLAAPPRAPIQPPAQAGFLSGLLRRARLGADGAPTVPDEAEGDDRLRARIGEAIRARSPGGAAEPEAQGVEAQGVPAALAAALQAARGRAAPVPAAAPRAARQEPPVARRTPSGPPAPPPSALPEPLPESWDGEGDEPDDVNAWDVMPTPPAPAPRAPARPSPARRQVPPYEPPPLDLLADPARIERHHLPDERLEQNARDLEGVLDDYGVKGEITSVRPGPVVTMYELEPAPGLKASRVIGLSDDIARSMEALSARVSTVPGRSVIGIELPNERRERVVLREILAAREFGDAQQRLPLALGKDIGGAPIVANLAKMPHLLIAGTTGSGKSVAINTMILSLLYKLTPEECRLIMIDPKMLELSVYDGIPHLLSPVVTDPKKAVVALKWVVGEMEERYRKMSKMGVRNIEGYNGRVRDALGKGEMFKRTVQTGFDDETGDPVFETDEFVPEVLPFIVVIVDEMADLMMVAGKEIEACIQRLAQMARASGIHLIMATQRPSVDVITGTIKANFPTRISFQVTSKIDSRTILGEQGAEQLLGQGDMLYMAGGGRITRIHGPFCSDEEVEEVVSHLKSYGPPDYMAAVLEEPEGDGEGADPALPAGGETEDALYDMAVQIVARDRKCSTSYIQRKLAIGYNKAARLVEQMEEQGVVTRANQVGKREILVPEPH